MDIHKERIAIAVAESGRAGAVEYLGEIANEPGAVGKLCNHLRLHSGVSQGMRSARAAGIAWLPWMAPLA
ncbi:MAG: hypothetical protein ACREDM_15795 [Methylocella sp.]